MPETVYDQLLDYIFSDQVQPGEKLVERELAQKFSVSRVPIRESLAKMVAQGLLVDGGSRRGVRVRHYTPAESRQLVEFRSSLECCAIEMAAQKAEPEDVKRLAAICDEEESVDILADRDAWGDLDHRFHAAVAQAGHNSRIISTLESLLTECHFIFYIHPRSHWTGSVEEAAEIKARVLREHRQLVAAIAQGDASLGIETLRRHLFI